jgi:predicted DNA-binding protein (MmcQ/YjbR family)
MIIRGLENALAGLDLQGVFLKDPRFYKTPYIGRKGWVSLKLRAAPLDWPEITELIKASYQKHFQ